MALESADRSQLARGPRAPSEACPILRHLFVRRRTAVALLLLAIAAAGCRIDVTAGLAIERDGTGEAGLDIELDGEALRRLDELALDPFAELAAAAVDSPGWSVERQRLDDGLRVRLRTSAEDPDSLADALRDLAAGLGPDDPALLVDLDVDVTGGGAARIDGRIELRPPATAGARLDGEPIGPAGDELAAIVAESVAARLEVSLPGRVTEHDADAVHAGHWFTAGGSTLVWDLAVGEEREVHAVSAAPPTVSPWMVAAGVSVLLLIVLVVVLWWRRRR